MGRRLGIWIGVALAVGMVLGAWLAQPRNQIISAAPWTPKATAPVTFYQWNDAQGGKQVTSTPPPAGVPFQTVTQDAVLTTMDAPKPPEQQSVTAPTIGNPLDVYSPANMGRVMQDAQNAAQAMVDAQQQQRKAIEAAR